MTDKRQRGGQHVGGVGLVVHHHHAHGVVRAGGRRRGILNRTHRHLRPWVADWFHRPAGP